MGSIPNGSAPLQVCARQISKTTLPGRTGKAQVQGLQHTGAFSSGEAEGDSEGNITHADEGEDDAYGEGDDCCGDSAVHFREQFGNRLVRLKYPVPRHFVPRFREAHAIAAMFHHNVELAAKFRV
jgi:hypothetical protein